MTEESPSLVAPATPAAPAGWYLDPWSRGQHRYWDGSAWTGGAFPNGPAPAGAAEGVDAAEVPAVPPPAARHSTPPPPPQWSAPAVAPLPPATAGWGPATAPPEEPTSPSRTLSAAAFVALVVGVMLVVGSLGTLGGYLIFRHHGSSSPTATGLPPNVAPTTPATTVPSDPSASVLATLGLTQSDVDPTIVVQPFAGGDQLSETPEGATLNLCNGTFPSESLRTARLQVAAFDTGGNSLLSTEAVLYQNAAATAQAFSELKSVAANCPSTPVDSPIGQDPLITQFNPAPDGSWPQVAGVTRLAFDLNSTDEIGDVTHSDAVYLRRGRVLLGIYFYTPDPQIAVGGQTTMEAITGLFAARMAALPASVVNG